MPPATFASYSSQYGYHRQAPMAAHPGPNPQNPHGYKLQPGYTNDEWFVTPASMEVLSTTRPHQKQREIIDLERQSTRTGRGCRGVRWFKDCCWNLKSPNGCCYGLGEYVPEYLPCLIFVLIVLVLIIVLPIVLTRKNSCQLLTGKNC